MNSLTLKGSGLNSNFKYIIKQNNLKVNCICARIRRQSTESATREKHLNTFSKLPSNDILSKIPKKVNLFARRATSFTPQGVTSLMRSITSFLTKSKHRFVSVSGMKLSYAQMKLSAKADKRSYVLADINTKNKGLPKKSFIFWRYVSLLNRASKFLNLPIQDRPLNFVYIIPQKTLFFNSFLIFP